MTDARRQLGALGEDAVERWYVARGYAVVARNWRVKEGELDLVVQRGRMLVFCEVKTRRTDAYGTPFDAITVAKQQRLRTLALRFLAEHRGRVGAMRFDVAAVRMSLDGTPEIEVLADAF